MMNFIVINACIMTFKMKKFFKNIRSEKYNN